VNRESARLSTREWNDASTGRLPAFARGFRHSFVGVCKLTEEAFLEVS